MGICRNTRDPAYIRAPVTGAIHSGQFALLGLGHWYYYRSGCQFRCCVLSQILSRSYVSEITWLAYRSDASREKIGVVPPFATTCRPISLRPWKEYRRRRRRSRTYLHARQCWVPSCERLHHHRLDAYAGIRCVQVKTAVVGSVRSIVFRPLSTLSCLIVARCHNNATTGSCPRWN